MLAVLQLGEWDENKVTMGTSFWHLTFVEVDRSVLWKGWGGLTVKADEIRGCVHDVQRYSLFQLDSHA